MEPGNNRNEENISVSQNVIRPRDLRSSKKKGMTPFSRTSAARPSLGVTSYAWMEAAERIEAKSAEAVQSTTTWPRRKKTTLIYDNDLMWEYDKDLIKKARIVSCKSSLDLEQTSFLFQAIFDKTLKRYWGLRVMRVDPSWENLIALPCNEVIVRINEEELLDESKDKILSVLVNEFAKPHATMIALLNQEDRPLPVSCHSLPSPNCESLTSNRRSNCPTMSPISYIKGFLPEQRLNLNAFNTRSIGQRITVDLHKLEEGGFGISFATRDALINTEEMQPVFVERIMPTGAAIHDGRLQFGDRLLSINGVQVTNFKDAMATLKSVRVGEKATLVFSRQDSVVVRTPSISSPILIAPSKDRSSTCTLDTTPDIVVDSPLCQTIIFEIAIPSRGSGTSSLGIRFEEWSEPRIIHAYSEFKGSEVTLNHMVGDTDGLEDNLSGFFVKQISTGSPASQDLASGVIRPGDRLIAVNGRSVIGLSLTEISAELKMAIEEAQCKMVRKSEQAFLKLSMNRFFHRGDKQSSCSKAKSILRSGSDAMFDKLTMYNNSNQETQIKKVNVLTTRDQKESPEIPLRRLARTPSVDSRGRSRRERGSRSPSDSPLRCQSAFTRDGVGRRSVSEKRHAHISAANVLPFCNKDDGQASRLYSTMPASRRIRQIRRSKQSRSSGPIKPVHGEGTDKPQQATGTAESPNFLRPLTPKRQSDDSDVLRTDATDGPLTTPSQLSRPRSHNHSFRTAVGSESFHRSPPPTPPKPIKDWCLQDDTHRSVTPPLPARRSRVPSLTTDFGRMDSTPKSINPSPPPLNSPSSTSAAQHKVFEELLQARRGDKKDAYCFSSSRKGSYRSCGDEEEEIIESSITSLPRASTKHVILTDVRPLASDLRKTPSPVDFNAYAVEQREIPYFSEPTRTKSPHNFLEEVETCLPKRRISRVNESLQVEEPKCSAPELAATIAQKNLPEPSPPVILQEVCSTVPNPVARKSDFSNRPLSRQAWPISYCDSRNNNSSAWSPIPRSNVQAHVAAVKPDSPHAIVRSCSPSSAHGDEAKGGYGRPSASVPFVRHRRSSHSLNRTANSSSKAQPDLKSSITFPEFIKCEHYQVFAPSYSPTAAKSGLTKGDQDNRAYLLNNQPQLPFHPLPSLKLSRPRLNTSPVLITTQARQIRRLRIQSKSSTSANISELQHHFLPPPSFYPTFAFGRP